MKSIYKVKINDVKARNYKCMNKQRQGQCPAIPNVSLVAKALHRLRAK